MLASFISPVKKLFRNRLPGEFLLIGTILVALVITFFSTVVMAENERLDNALGYYTKDGEVHWIYPEDNIITTDTRGLSQSELEELYPMSPDAEASIVHPEPKCPVIIDGIRCEGKDISKYNGKRLYFVIGRDGTLYAFTTAKGMEEFQFDYFEPAAPLYAGIDSLFFQNINYGGNSFALLTGDGLPYLYQIGLDKALSSGKISVTASWAYLYDSYYFQGNCLKIFSGIDIPDLGIYGWNDRASSVRTEY